MLVSLYLHIFFIKLNSRAVVNGDKPVLVRLCHLKGNAQRLPAYGFINAYMEILPRVGHKEYHIAVYPVMVKYKMLRGLHRMPACVAAEHLNAPVALAYFLKKNSCVQVGPGEHKL